MNEETIKYIIARVIDNANDALEEERKNKDDAFYKGKKADYIFRDVMKFSIRSKMIWI